MASKSPYLSQAVPLPNGLNTVAYQPLTNWDDPPNRPLSVGDLVAVLKKKHRVILEGKNLSHLEKNGKSSDSRVPAGDM